MKKIFLFSLLVVSLYLGTDYPTVPLDLPYEV